MATAQAGTSTPTSFRMAIPPAANILTIRLSASRAKPTTHVAVTRMNVPSVAKLARRRPAKQTPSTPPEPMGNGYLLCGQKQ